MGVIKVGNDFFQYNEGARNYLENTKTNFSIVEEVPSHVNVLDLPKHHAHKEWKLGVNTSGEVRRYDDLKDWEQEIIGRPRGLFDNYPA